MAGTPTAHLDPLVFPRGMADNIELRVCGVKSNPDRKLLVEAKSDHLNIAPIPSLLSTSRNVIMSSPTGKGKKNVRIDSLPVNRRVASRGSQTAVAALSAASDAIGQFQNARSVLFAGFLVLDFLFFISDGIKVWLAEATLRAKKYQSYVRSSRETKIASPRKNQINPCQGACASRNSDLTKQQLSNSLSDKLLQHFLSNVAFRLTWLDGPSNPWRSLVLPLAKRSSCLRLSILGLAAAHLSAISPEHDRLNMLQVNHRIRDEILGVLSRKMRFELCKTPFSSNEIHQDPSLIETLASMVVLCYGEMHIPGSPDWRLHLRACRAIIERHGLQISHGRSQDHVVKFFIKEVVDLETFGNVSVFTTALSSQEAIPGSLLSDEQPWVFTSLIRDITLAERSQYGHSSKCVRSPTRVDMQHWHIRILQAYDKATAMTALLPAGQVSLEIHFRAIIEAHYHACLIYSYQALVPHARETGAFQPSIDLLWQIIESFATDSFPAFAHDIFFPLFVAGTECHSTERRSQIEALFLQSISTTGFWCNYTVLQFLRLFWESGNVEVERNWIQFARQNESQINTFCVF
ncbi:hypothetical protein N7532_005136 [Penicillium argentinense]|uniref:Fungal-specific transcription factor domain-containing protein n=1 Tax=Penicillium argentinense TaxID=1131581 RepID=A0A9W9FDB7_9EURO|nr:uncharacterized protein N7532_005136 [Penicillium argentinense]KAJ5098135.1 hypothetical protein N7532_005136 [Penicillium argentinense]